MSGRAAYRHDASLVGQGDDRFSSDAGHEPTLETCWARLSTAWLLHHDPVAKALDIVATADAAEPRMRILKREGV